MSETTSVKLKSVSFNYDQFCRLSEHEQILLALLSYAISETNALWRVFVCAIQTTTGTVQVDQAVAVQRGVLLRTWSSKLFEFDKALKDLRQRPKIDPALKSFVDDMRSKLAGPDKTKIPKLVEEFRNEAGNHATVSAAKKNLDFLSKTAPLNMLFSDLEANTVLPLGEELFFAARYNRYLSETGKDRLSIDPFEEWLAWNQAATRELMAFIDEYLTTFVFKEKCHSEWEEIELHLSKVFADSASGRQVPIFLKMETQ
ncbi:hypothetical protein [uncultured Sulfitobacter sp.]|uniref:hypothetical protein n=1 Tax=uncultured Sulfitobacter sp. TaxID=191468 RepID=UPI00262A592B|nr:hypothetical protein [uncultured Sulfitobacter sp.]